MYNFYNNLKGIIKEPYIYNPDDYLKAFLIKFNKNIIFNIFLYKNYICIQEVAKYHNIYKNYYFYEYYIRKECDNIYLIYCYVVLSGENIKNNCYKLNKLFMYEYFVKI